jgi:Tfp pilus tip-associated adhesin PilY1
MAIKLTDKPNTIPPDSDYPYGDIRDRNGLIPGTPVSREVYADFHQFFERIMAMTNTAHNGLPENNVNGYQYPQAVFEFCNPFVMYNVRLTQSGTSAPTATFNFVSTGSVSWSYVSTGVYRITLNTDHGNKFECSIGDLVGGNDFAKVYRISNTVFEVTTVFFDDGIPGFVPSNNLLSNTPLIIKIWK